MRGKLPLFLARLKSLGKRPRFMTVAAGVALLTASAFMIACGGSSGGSNSDPSPPSVPSIHNINNSTDPSSPINLPIVINGSGFQGSPGKVAFTQSSRGLTTTVTPNSSGWTDNSIAVTVPSGDGANQFTVPGTVSVEVTTSAGTSDSATLTLDRTVAFNVNNMYWTATATALPTALTGLGAVAVPVSDTSAFVVVTGGYDGSGNTSNVYCNTLNPDGTVGPSWTNIPTNLLPETIAYHAMVEADSTNSPVSTGSHFVYVLGGQFKFGDTPGGTTNIYMASVNSNSGAVGAWTQLASPLPVPLVGPAVVLYEGYVYVVGGLNSNSTQSSQVYSAPIKSDGTLGSWTQSDNPYPMGISFATAFVYANRLYLLGGDNTGSVDTGSVDPGAQGNAGVKDVYFASVLNGVVGPWTSTSPTLMNRKKAVTWRASNTVIDAEGVYNGTVEVEYSTINTDGTLSSWLAVPSGSQINANVYNAAAIVSPLASPVPTPRFILMGGENFVTYPPGPISNSVYYTNDPGILHSANSQPRSEKDSDIQLMWAQVYLRHEAFPQMSLSPLPWGMGGETSGR